MSISRLRNVPARVVGMAVLLGCGDGRLTAGPPVPAQGSSKASVTVGMETFVFQGGECSVSADAFGMIVGDALKGERFELNIPHPVRAQKAPKPAGDGSYTNASVTVIPAGGTKSGKRWHAGGRTATEADVTVVLKNNRKSGEFSGRTDGSPRTPIKGSFSC